MASERFLIVNADDFGHSAPVNDGIVEAHERGIVTSASLMVRRPAAADAVSRARNLALGLHVELGEWSCRDGEWHGTNAVPDMDVTAEVRRQLEEFRQLAGREPTHLDSHQHVHRREPARTALAEVAEKLRIALRGFAPHIRYCGEFYGQDDRGREYPELVTSSALIALLERLPAGVTELGCHPGRGEIPGSSYSAERELEVAALCDPLLRSTLVDAEIRLVSFADLAEDSWPG